MALGLRQLRYFLAIAEAGALSRAAEGLNIAQSALSRHVKELERGLRDVERAGRGREAAALGDCDEITKLPQVQCRLLLKSR